MPTSSGDVHRRSQEEGDWEKEWAGYLLATVDCGKWKCSFKKNAAKPRIAKEVV